MIFSKVFLSCLSTWDNCFQEQLLFILHIGDKISIIVEADDHNTLTRVPLPVRVRIVVQYVAFLNLEHQVLKTDSS